MPFSRNIESGSVAYYDDAFISYAEETANEKKNVFPKKKVNHFVNNSRSGGVACISCVTTCLE